MDEDTNDKIISKFNMAQAILQGVNTTMIKSFRKYEEGNIKSWFFCLKSSKMQIISKFNSDERKKLKDLELKITNGFKNETTTLLTIPNIENYNELLQDLMEEKGLLLINKEDQTIFT